MSRETGGGGRDFKGKQKQKIQIVSLKEGLVTSRRRSNLLFQANIYLRIYL